MLPTLVKTKQAGKREFLPTGVLADPHVIARGALASVPDTDFGEVKMPGVVPRLSATPGAIHSTGPALGAHNAEVYGAWLGLSDEQQDGLKRDGVI